ncbi:hypothetical protein E3A20_06950 [Planctomyces bekefii]|uniref:PilZ domain-containing protein n=1 Tax=Planctomyces bekefii TaxID=1653850 RepID=A0A5C6M843_9PLAN|nr:hypothetical protein E3A20_06950 [Planctomyces bekefii]
MASSIGSGSSPHRVGGFALNTGENARVLLVDAGDQFQGTLLSNWGMAILGYSFLMFDQKSDFSKYSQLGFMAIMAGLTLFLANRDTLFPFIDEKSRFWRKNARIKVNIPATVELSNNSRRKVTVENLSYGGMMLVIDGGGSQRAYDWPEDAKTLTVEFSERSGSGKKLSVFCTIAESKREDGKTRVRVKVSDARDMIPVFRIVGEMAQVSRNYHTLYAYFLSSTAIRRATLGIWAVSIIGSAGMPACGVQEDFGAPGAGSEMASEGGSFDGASLTYSTTMPQPPMLPALPSPGSVGDVDDYEAVQP